MGKRKRDPQYIRNKIKKLEMRLKDSEESPPTPPPPEEIIHEPDPVDQEPAIENLEETLPEDFLLALGHEGEDKEERGEPIINELVIRWKKIITEGLKKEQKDALFNKYPTPSNFEAAVAPIMNREIGASLSELSLNRDKRICARQNLTGKILNCLAKALTAIMKGNINIQKLIEEINDAAKLAGEMYHLDTNSRKFFALSNTSKAVQEACKEVKSGKFLFGDNLQEQLKAIETVKRTAQQIKVPENKKHTATKPVNWRSPSQYQINQRGRGGHQPMRRPTYQPPRRPPPSRGIQRQAAVPRRAHHRRY